MNIQQAIKELIIGHDITGDQMHDIMHAIMTGESTPAQIAGFLVALTIKGETIEEITAAANVMRELATKVNASKEHLVDTCGTGGDGANTFNISTTSAFVAAAAGAHVAKHGNRSISSKSGSADVLEAADVKLELTPEQVSQCIESTGIGFMFAPAHHSAMKHAIGPRRELGVRTIFNILGPLTNPAGAPNQLLGVFHDKWRRKLAEVLQRLGSEHVMVVHAEDGMDEISISTSTHITELKNGELQDKTITPEQFGLVRADVSKLTVSSVKESFKTMLDVLENTPGPARDIVCLNAGAAIYTAGICNNLDDGVSKAIETIASGAAREKLRQFVKVTQSL